MEQTKILVIPIFCDYCEIRIGWDETKDADHRNDSFICEGCKLEREK